MINLNKGFFFEIRMIRYRLLLGFILVGLLPVIGVGIGTYIVSYQNGLQQAVDRLESVSARKELSIQVWIQSLGQELQVAAQSDYAPKLIINALKLSNENASYSWYNNLVSKRLNYFVSQSDQLVELFLVDLKGNVVVSTNLDVDYGSFSELITFIGGYTRNYIELPFSTSFLPGEGISVNEDRSTVLILSPVSSDDGSMVGWIGGKFELNPLKTNLQENTGLGETGIAYLVNWDHSTLSGVNSLFLYPEGVNPSNSIDTQGVNSAIKQGINIKGIYNNPSGTSVIGVYRWLPDLKVVLCVEQDTREAFQGVFDNTIVNLIIAFCALIFAVMAGLYMTQSIANPIVNLANTASQITRGDLERTAVIQREDEVGALAKAFNSMTAQLRDLINSLEQRVEDRTRDLKNANEELKQRAIQLETSAKVARDITSILNIDLLLKRVVELIQETFGYYHVQVFLYDKECNILQLGAGSGNRISQHQQLKVDGQGINSQAIKTGNTQLVNDINQSQHYLYDEGLPETRSELVIPLKVGRKVIGSLDIHDTRVNAFDEKDLLVLQSLGDQIAIAIENTRLYNQSRDLAILEERHRLARELHDSVTQSLYSLVLLTEGWRRMYVEKGNIDIENYLTRIGEIASQSLKEMRLLILELRPPTLEQEGLVGALQKRLDAVEKRVGILARVVMEEFCDIPIAVEKDLYWIAQEALNNSLKHANANQVTVSLHTEGELIILKVSDDGIGFNPDAIENQGGMGLFNMRERATRIGGSMTIQSAVGEGAIVTAAIPLNPKS